ncbi:uncharacterized protein LOC121377955 [Gigantopelta aegis]|uniref:uncharacterized protein LOC121377955 n=1 Tax=Gigantopelta aegis TaxID=1735272 RepID=UPI001B88C4DF|nr:uncharacterized protein LOC121377955 [Gigantopelta aegis]
MCSIICGREHTTDELYDVKTSELAELKSSNATLYQRAKTDFNFPRIVIKDPAGKTLDTHTSLQEAIYRAKWNVQTSGTAILPEEWRLPKAPLPARPDFTRTGPLSSKKKHDLTPLIHKDKAMKTGGGYTFWQKDRPVNSKIEKSMDFYPVTIPSVELRQLLEDTTLSDAAKRALKKRLTAQYPWLQDIPFDHTMLDRLRSMGLLTEDGQMWKEKEKEEDDEGIVSGDHEDSDLYRVSRSRLENWIALDAVDSELSERRSRRSKEKRSVQADVKGKDDVEHTAHLDKEDTEDTENQEKKPKLYNAPTPFKLKEKQRRITVSESPFSTNRQYDLSKGPGFQLKKNEKQTTKFTEFNRSQTDWKEPDRFQVKKAERKTINFFVPKAGDKKKGRREKDDYDYDYEAHYKRNRKDLEQPLSPDSGLASEIVSDSVKGSSLDRDSTLHGLSATDVLNLQVVPIYKL